MAPVDLGDEVWLVDTQMGGYDGITAGYLIRGERPCLVETGPARSADEVVEGLATLGVGADDLATIAVTHIHLDHAGGVGTLAAAFPNAQVAVQERGARHLVDPTKLVASAHRVFGADMDRLFGDLRPVPSERLVVLGETGSIDLGDRRRLDAFHNPGHASHHVGLLDSLSGDLYTGDAAGVYVPEIDTLRPATPPPDFDLEQALTSIRSFAERRPTRLLFSHFGPVDDVPTMLERAEDELRVWVELVRETRLSELDLDHAVQRVTERTADRYAAYLADPSIEEKFEHLSATAANVAGINRWLDQVEGVQVTRTDPSSLR